MTQTASERVRLVATDEDGTFLDGGGESFDRKRFARVFARMREAGCHFVVATGNQNFQVRDIFSDVADEISYVTSNGGYVEAEGELLYVACAPRDAVERVLAVHAEHPQIPLQMIGAHGSYVEPGISQELFDIMNQYSHRLAYADDLSAVDDDVIMFSSYAKAEDQLSSMSLFEEALDGEMDVVDSGVEDGIAFFDIVQPGMSKAVGLRRLMDHWGIAPEEVVAFGDSGNDVAMLQLAGVGYAMGNAPDEIKASADRVCAPCREQGVLQVLEELFGA